MKRKIVHLDDQLLFLDGLRMSIGSKFTIKQFRHPDEALAYIKLGLETKNKIDLIITDMKHVGMNGLEFANAVRNLEKQFNCFIPIIILSMYVTESINSGNINQIEKEFFDGENNLIASNGFQKVFINYFRKGIIQSFLSKAASPVEIMVEINKSITI